MTEFKPGDRVLRIGNANRGVRPGREYVVREFEPLNRALYLVGHDLAFGSTHFTLVERSPMINGWHEITEKEFIEAYRGLSDRAMIVTDHKPIYMAPNVPMLPLPTEPYISIRVEWKSGRSAPATAVLTLDELGRWGRLGRELSYAPEKLFELITGWKLLSKPVPE